MIPPIYVKPFVKRQKNDAADAAAIAEAVLRPNLHYVAVKSAEHQARAVAFRTHQCFVGQRTQLINALRGHLAEFGVVVAQGPARLKAVTELLRRDAIDLPDAVPDAVKESRIRWIIRKGVLPDNWLGRMLARKPRMVAESSRVCRRPFGLSHATMVCCLNIAW